MRSQHKTTVVEAGTCSGWFLKFVLPRTDVRQAVVLNYFRLPLQSVVAFLEVLAIYIQDLPTSTRRLMTTPRNQHVNISKRVVITVIYPLGAHLPMS